MANLSPIGILLRETKAGETFIVTGETQHNVVSKARYAGREVSVERVAVIDLDFQTTPAWRVFVLK